MVYMSNNSEFEDMNKHYMSVASIINNTEQTFYVSSARWSRRPWLPNVFSSLSLINTIAVYLDCIKENKG